jgi:hypothetical protein
LICPNTGSTTCGVSKPPSSIFFAHQLRQRSTDFSRLPLSGAGRVPSVRRRLNNVKHLLAEGAQKLPGVGRADAPDHSGRQVLLDAIGRGRRRCSREPRFELMAVRPIVDPFA